MTERNTTDLSPRASVQLRDMRMLIQAAQSWAGHNDDMAQELLGDARGLGLILVRDGYLDSLPSELL